jgi:hypothetical protein
VGFFVFLNPPPAIARNRTTRSYMSTPQTKRIATPHAGTRLPINVDATAIAIGLALAALIRFGVIHHVSF